MRRTVLALALVIPACTAPFEPALGPYEAYQPFVIEGPAVLSAYAVRGEWLPYDLAIIGVRFSNPGTEVATVTFAHCSLGVSARDGARLVGEFPPEDPLACPWGEVTLDMMPGQHIDRDVWMISREAVRPEGGLPRSYHFEVHILIDGEEKVRRIDAGTRTF